MKKIATLAIVAAAALSATAAAAQPMAYGRGNHWEPINQRQAQMERQIDRGVQRGTITRAEARRLVSEFRSLSRLEARYRMNGLSYAERADLDRRFDRLAMQIRIERRDRDYGYGYGQRR
jgi:hypothetical protein